MHLTAVSIIDIASTYDDRGTIGELMFYRCVSSLVVTFVLFAGRLDAIEVVFNADRFEMGTAGEVPAGWKAFPRAAKPSVKMVKGVTN